MSYKTDYLCFLDEYYALCGVVPPTRPTGPEATAFPPGGTPGPPPITGENHPSFVLYALKTIVLL